MKFAEPLFEFMPYGAPELLQSRRERLASALLLSSLTIAIAFVVAGGLARMIVVPPVVIPTVEYTPHDFVHEPTWAPPPLLPPATPQPHTKPLDGVFVPSAEPDMPLVKDKEKTAVIGVPGPENSVPSNGEATAPTPPELLPGPKDYVYAEQYPEPVTQVKPLYPEIAQTAGVEGLVIVKVLVGKNGRVLDALLDEKRRVPLLDDAALEAARKWVFTPALANGKPVAVWTAIPFHFRLH
jgi:protein TonB